MELIFILFGIIVIAAVIVAVSNKRNKTYIIKNSKTDLTLSSDDIIKLRETVGKFKKGEKHYCNVCDSVSIHLEEDLSGEIIGIFSIFNFLLPWKWAIVASLFFLKDEKIQTVCVSCNPSFYEDWLTYRKRESKIFFRNILITLSILFLLYLFLS
jgi:hypothetical protein